MSNFSVMNEKSTKKQTPTARKYEKLFKKKLHTRMVHHKPFFFQTRTGQSRCFSFLMRLASFKNLPQHLWSFGTCVRGFLWEFHSMCSRPSSFKTTYRSIYKNPRRLLSSFHLTSIWLEWWVLMYYIVQMAHSKIASFDCIGWFGLRASHQRSKHFDLYVL